MNVLPTKLDRVTLDQKVSEARQLISDFLTSQPDSSEHTTLKTNVRSLLDELLHASAIGETGLIVSSGPGYLYLSQKTAQTFGITLPTAPKGLLG